MEFLAFFGRLHPLILHLPIGFLGIAFIMECFSKRRNYEILSPAIGFILRFGMWMAILASISGFVLSREGGYDSMLLDRHQWLGIGTALISLVVYILHQRKESGKGGKLYFPLFTVLIILIGITGHLGGSLSHGSDFLTAPFSKDFNKEKQSIANMDSALVFQDLIHPILKEKCNSCHNESKLKGDLLLSTIEGIKKGGEAGAFLKAGEADNSLFLKRVYLPIEEKEHMPPKGKRQLTEDEVRLLEWWVNQGASFDQQVGALEQAEDIKSILAKYTQTDKSVFALKVSPVKESTLNKLRKSGIIVETISKDHGFVKASLRGRKDLNKSTFRTLKSIAEQLVDLDLSETNMDDQLLSSLKNFPHLQKLFLQKTKVSGSNLQVLEKLEYLEYLNLYETPLKDEAIQSLTKLVGLENLYLWKANLSPKAVEQLRNERPKLNINTGIDKSIFGDAELKPPIISVDKDIFKDSVRVEFNINFRGVDLHYTLDGTAPDSTSEKYREPFLLDHTADIKVIARKKGWKTSQIAQKSVVRAKYQAAKVLLNKKPNDRYKAEGGASLANFKKGTLQFTEGEWLGYEGEHFVANLDMGKVLDISKVSVSALESTGSWIFFPKQLKVSLSKNGKTYTNVIQKSIPTTAGPEPAVIRSFILGFDTQEARYIKVEINSNLVNPSWHPAPGQKCWVFVDEILVE